MKKSLMLLILLLGMISFGERLYIYQGFSYLTGSVDIASGKVVVPVGGNVDVKSFSATYLPEGTVITYVEPDNLKALYERYIGKVIEFVLSNGSRQSFVVVDSTPVLKDQAGSLYFAPQGTPVFPGGSYNTNSSFEFDFPVLSPIDYSYSYRLT